MAGKKNKGIKKAAGKGHQKLGSSLSGTTSSTRDAVIGKRVGLVKKQLSLQNKQQIFDKVVEEASKKKVPRKERKKQRYLIKKVTKYI